MATTILGQLASRSAANCAAIAAEGALTPLTTLLGDGRNASELQIRVADALFHLSHSTSNKEAIIKAGGVRWRSCRARGCVRLTQAHRPRPARHIHIHIHKAASRLEAGRGGGCLASKREAALNSTLALPQVPPLVKMLTSSNLEAQTKAAAAICHLAATTAGQQFLTSAAGVPVLVQLLSSERLDAAKYAAGALWHLEALGENKVAIVRAGGILPLVRLLRRQESGEAQELAGARAQCSHARQACSCAVSDPAPLSERKYARLPAVAAAVACQTD